MDDLKDGTGCPPGLVDDKHAGCSCKACMPHRRHDPRPAGLAVGPSCESPRATTQAPAATLGLFLLRIARPEAMPISSGRPFAGDGAGKRRAGRTPRGYPFRLRFPTNYGITVTVLNCRSLLRMDEQLNTLSPQCRYAGGSRTTSFLKSSLSPST
jgi:hypothetical protein